MRRGAAAWIACIACVGRAGRRGAASQDRLRRRRAALRARGRHRRVRARARALRRERLRRDPPGRPHPVGRLDGLQQDDAAGCRERPRDAGRGRRHAAHQLRRVRRREPAGRALRRPARLRVEPVPDVGRRDREDRRADLPLREGALHHLPLPGRRARALGDQGGPRRSRDRRLRHGAQHHLRGARRAGRVAALDDLSAEDRATDGAALPGDLGRQPRTASASGSRSSGPRART